MNELHNLYVYPATPIHIGAGEQSDWQKELDFIQEDDFVKLINWNALFKKHPNRIDQYSAQLKSSRLKLKADERLFTNELYAPMAIRDALAGLVRDGLGRPYLPGSSLKGALSSVFLHDAKPLSSQHKDSKTLAEFTGTFQNNLFNAIQIGDVYFDKTQVLPSKIYNLMKESGGEWIAGWKHGHQRTNEKFNNKDFITPLEVFTPNQEGHLRVVFQPEKVKKSLADASRKAAGKIGQMGFWPFFKNAMNTASRAHLEREITFLEYFEGENRDTVLKGYNYLLKLINLFENNDFDTALLRVGFGSGYHSLTGNWHFDNHIHPVEHPRNGKHYKSRKLLFYSKNGSYHFLPLGFIIISAEKLDLSTPSWFPPYDEKKADKEATAAQEKPKPEWIKPEEVKDQMWLDAEVIGQEGKYMILKLFIEGGQYENVKFSYPSGWQKDALVKVKIDFIRKKLNQGFNVREIRER